MSDLTQLLHLAGNGDPLASEQLLKAVYGELHRMAAARLTREPEGQTLSPTGLVHEAYLRIAPQGGIGAWNSRGHFFSAASEAMRRILVEAARRKQSLRRGGNHQRVPLAAEVADPTDSDERLIALNEALDALFLEKPRVAELVKLRYFAGLSIEEAAECLEISDRTAHYWWAFAKAWLKDSMDDRDHA